MFFGEADFDLTVYDEQGNQVGMAVANEDGTKTLTIPCDWSNSRKFVIKVSQNGSAGCVQGNYKLTFSQGEIPKDVKDALERMQSGEAELVESNPKKRASLRAALKEKNETRNLAETEKLHQAQYNALPEELKYRGDSTMEELLEKELRGEPVTAAERAYIAIYGNQNEIYHVECQKRIGFSIIVITLIASTWDWLFQTNDAKLLFITITLSFAFALTGVLAEYLLYRYDSKECDGE